MKKSRRNCRSERWEHCVLPTTTSIIIAQLARQELCLFHAGPWMARVARNSATCGEAPPLGRRSAAFDATVEMTVGVSSGEARIGLFALPTWQRGHGDCAPIIMYLDLIISLSDFAFKSQARINKSTTRNISNVFHGT